MVTYSLMRIAHAPWCNRLKCTTTATKPPRMSAVVQAGGTPNFNDVNLSPPLPHLSLSPCLHQSHYLQLFKLATLHGYNYIIHPFQIPRQRLAHGKMQCY